MKTTKNYKKGDVVLLSDGNRYEYLGKITVEGRVVNAYKPLDGKTGFGMVKGGFVPFSDKVAAKAGLGWYDKVLRWWKESNHWKHFLFAIPLGAVCGAPFTTGVGLGMEVKDHLYGGKADFVDFALTAVGGFIGHGVMLLIGLDYLIMTLIKLIF